MTGERDTAPQYPQEELYGVMGEGLGDGRKLSDVSSVTTPCIVFDSGEPTPLSTGGTEESKQVVFPDVVDRELAKILADTDHLLEVDQEGLISTQHVKEYLAALVPSLRNRIEYHYKYLINFHKLLKSRQSSNKYFGLNREQALAFGSITFYYSGPYFEGRRYGLVNKSLAMAIDAWLEGSEVHQVLREIEERREKGRVSSHSSKTQKDATDSLYLEQLESDLSLDIDESFFYPEAQQVDSQSDLTAVYMGALNAGMFQEVAEAFFPAAEEAGNSRSSLTDSEERELTPDEKIKREYYVKMAQLHKFFKAPKWPMALSEMMGSGERAERFVDLLEFESVAEMVTFLKGIASLGVLELTPVESARGEFVTGISWQEVQALLPLAQSYRETIGQVGFENAPREYISDFAKLAKVYAKHFTRDVEDAICDPYEPETEQHEEVTVQELPVQENEESPFYRRQRDRKNREHVRSFLTVLTPSQREQYDMVESAIQERKSGKPIIPDELISALFGKFSLRELERIHDICQASKASDSVDFRTVVDPVSFVGMQYAAWKIENARSVSRFIKIPKEMNGSIVLFGSNVRVVKEALIEMQKDNPDATFADVYRQVVG